MASAIATAFGRKKGFSGMGRMTRSLIVFLYSVVMVLALPLLRIVSWFRRDLAEQLKDRPKLVETGRRLGKLRASKSKAVMIFASSAGEYEQAKPLMDRLRGDPDVFVHVVFFSRSGADYARKRGEQASWCLAPVDTLWHWGWLFSAVSPDVTIVVRHELWPAFLHTAKEWGPVYLIDAAVPLVAGKAGRLRRLAKTYLLDYFTRIFTVSELDAQALATTFSVPREKLVVAGDTKYDRVLERAKGGSDATALIEQQLSGAFPGRRRLVLGSVYPVDWQMLFSALAKARDKTWLTNWLPILAPHHVDEKSVAALQQDAAAAGFVPVLWTKMHQHSPGDQSLLIVDQMGMLAEVYASAEAAYVGGALHAKVHNVLEPAAYDLAIAFGPGFDNSVEAIALTEEKLATVVRDADEFSAWLASLSSLTKGAGTRQFVQNKAGTSDLLILETLALPNSDGQMLGAQ